MELVAKLPNAAIDHGDSHEIFSSRFPKLVRIHWRALLKDIVQVRFVVATNP